MELKRFGLGIRFDLMSDAVDDTAARYMLEEVFSVLTVSELKGLSVYGGISNSDKAAGQNIYTVVIMGGSLKEMRKIYEKLDNDAGINMYLASTLPYIENNRLADMEGLLYFGEVKADGTMKNGDHDMYSLSVPKRHGKKRPIGRGIKILLAPDSFKGTISSKDAIKRITMAARRNFPGVKVVNVPIADGGEGTVEAFVTAANGVYRICDASDPLGRRIKAAYGVIYGKTAVIETAQASGLTRINKDELDIMRASSLGTGELIRRALDEGVAEVIVGLGGSATNDGGMGCAIALGVKFYDGNGNELSGCGENLIKIKKIDTELLHPRLKNVKLSAFCDVSNPLTGENGATRVYAPQKGASAEQISELERGMENYRSVLKETFGVDANHVNGSGAAGGIGAMLNIILGAELKSGIDALLDAVRFETLLKGVSLVITGEGRLDAQTARYGKAVAGVMKRCRKRNIPVAILAGCMGEGAEEIYSLGNAGVMTLVNSPMTAEQAQADYIRLFDDAADRMFRFIRMGRDVEKLGAPKTPRH